jgi:hypothetical protein
MGRATEGLSGTGRGGRGRILRGTIGALCMLAAACATKPTPRATPDIRTVVMDGTMTRREISLRQEASVGQVNLPQSPAQVWAALPGVFATLGIDVTTHDVSAGTMGNTAYSARRIEGRRMSHYLDCGIGATVPIADEYEVTLGVLVRLNKGEDGQTVLTTSLDAFAKNRAVSGNAVHCQSYGTLERRIASLVSEKITS